MNDLCGGTAIREPEQQTEAISAARRIILLTDGGHNTGRPPFSLAEQLKAKGVVIECIGIGGNPGRVDEKGLKRIASTKPDGSPRYCFIGDSATLIRKFEELANPIRTA